MFLKEFRGMDGEELKAKLFAIGFDVALTPFTLCAFTGAVTITLRADRHNAFIA